MEYYNFHYKSDKRALILHQWTQLHLLHDSLFSSMHLCIIKGWSAPPVRGEKCVWMLGYSEHCCFLLYQSGLTVSVHNNLSFSWNDLQLSCLQLSKEETGKRFQCQQTANICIHFASLVTVFSKYKTCSLRGNSNPQPRTRAAKQHLALNWLISDLTAIQRQKHRFRAGEPKKNQNDRSHNQNTANGCISGTPQHTKRSQNPPALWAVSVPIAPQLH